MSYINPEQTAFKDSANLDAFGRLRTSVGAQLFGMSQEYTSHPLVWDAYTVSGGTAVHSATTNSTALSTAAVTSGARAIRQTKTYWRYTPGKSQLVKLTGVINASGTATGAAFAALGYYDDLNGLFFKYSSAGVAVVERSNVSGSVVEIAVLQSSWNIDKFDGTGPSGKTVDWTKSQIFMIDLQWLGAGRVRYALNIDGQTWAAHQSVHANMIAQAYMATANLPLRYEVFNSGGAGSNISLSAICSSVESEGGIDDQSIYPFAYSVPVVTIDGTMRPIVTRRLRDTFNGKTVRGQSKLSGFSLRVGSNDVYWEIRYNQTVTMGAGGSTTVNNVNATYSISEYDTYAGAANTVSGGVLIYNGYGLTGAGVVRGLTIVPGTKTMLQLGRTYANVRDTYTLSAMSLGASSTIAVATQFEEQY